MTIGNGVKGIGDGAFEDCSGLTSITIPDSVTSIGAYAFYGCSGLTSLYISDLAAYLNISYGNGSSNPMRYANVLYINNERAENVVIPDGVTAIPVCAFYGCKSLTSITIPDSVTKIGGNAFYGCSSLTSITIPDSVTSIGYEAFRDCSGLTSIYYSGTSEQWNGVTKGSDWKKNSPATIYVLGVVKAPSSKTYVSGDETGAPATGFVAEFDADNTDLDGVVWTVKSGGETRRTGSLNYGGTMTGSVQIGLVVAGLYDENATAAAANETYVEWTE